MGLQQAFCSCNFAPEPAQTLGASGYGACINTQKYNYTSSPPERQGQGTRTMISSAPDLSAPRRFIPRCGIFQMSAGDGLLDHLGRQQPVLEAVQDQLLRGCPPDAFLAEHRPDPDPQRWPERARRHARVTGSPRRPDPTPAYPRHCPGRSPGFCFHGAPQGRHAAKFAPVHPLWPPGPALDRRRAPDCGVTAGLRSGIALDQAHPAVYSPRG